MKALLLIPLLALASCATKPVMPSAAPKPTRLSSPIVETIRKPVVTATKANTNLRVSNSKLGAAVKSAAVTADTTRKAAAAIQPGQITTPGAADAVKRASEENRQQIIHLADLVTEQSRIIEGQAIELAAARDATEYAVTAATLKDQEADSLRDYAETRDEALKSTLKENVKLTKKAANNAVYKRWVIGIAITLIIAGVLIVCLKSIKPL